MFVFCSFVNNTASGSGGAINVGRDPVGGPVLQIAHSSFVGNKALGGRGGAIYAEGSTILLRDVTFSGNNAREWHKDERGTCAVGGQVFWCWEAK